MSDAAADQEIERKANELYWGSEWSVNQIADELDLSKGVLYGIIRPRPSGLACPTCGEEVVYPNRTAKERRLVACASCGWGGEEMSADSAGGEAGVVLPLGGGPDEDEIVMPPIRLSSSRQRVVLGGILLGAAAGLALVIWARRRKK
ncbi:MAG TPA: hypothetical protein VLH75_05120 [Longimicrobiales bacterium]|nr:hypothetical protein [Longimicrobiales bacterium]